MFSPPICASAADMAGESAPEAEVSVPFLTSSTTVS